MQARRLTNRRQFLKLTALGAGATAALAACAPASPPTPTTAPKPTEAPKPAGAAPTTAPAATAAKPTEAPKPTVAAAPAKSTGPVGLAWDTFRGVGTPWPDNMIKSFKQKFPNVSVEFRPIPIQSLQQEAYPKMYAMYAAGTLGDVFAFDPSHWEFYRAIPQGILRPIDDLVSAEKFDLTQFFEPFINFQRWQGKLWGLPSWGWSGHDGILYNLRALEEAGITPPDHGATSWSMDTIYEHAAKLNKMAAGGRYDRFGISLSLAPIGITILSRAFGGDILSADGKKATNTSPEATKALKWMYDLCQKEKVVALPGSFQGSGDELFASGKLGMYMAGSLTVFTAGKAIKDPKVAEITAVLFPKRSDGKRASQMRGGTWNIGSKSKQPDWAWELVKHITSREGTLTFNTEGGNGALVRPDILDDPYFSKNPNFLVYKENLLTAMLPIVPGNYRGTEYEETYTQTLGELYLGKVGFDDGVKKLNDAVQRVLDKPMT